MFRFALIYSGPGFTGSTFNRGVTTNMPIQVTLPPCVVILLGPPGCGKGTQARELCKTLGFLHISTGDMLRSAAVENSALGREVAATMRAGKLVPDDLICRIVEERIAPHGDFGLVFDGFPRTPEQMKVLSSLRPQQRAIVLNLHVKPEVLVRRIMGRLTCHACGEIYNVFFRPPRQAAFCDHDQSQLRRRTDDTETVIRHRLVAYENETRPLADHFRQLGILRDVEADVDSAILSRELCTRVRLAVESVNAAPEI